MKFLCCAALVLVLVGCGKDAPAPPATQPASRPALPPATLTVGGEPLTFPVTTLEAIGEGGAIHVTLAGSDGLTEPKQSFYFTAVLNVDRPENLPGQIWRQKRSLSGDGDAAVEFDGAVGVFMEGNNLRFVPTELQIEFAGEWPDVTVTITGKLLRGGDESKPVSLNGKFIARASSP